ncbi:MAG: hypothetical protein ACNYPD_07085 [Candidatus Halichondribacter symbioticus]
MGVRTCDVVNKWSYSQQVQSDPTLIEALALLRDMVYRVGYE